MFKSDMSNIPRPSITKRKWSYGFVVVVLLGMILVGVPDATASVVQANSCSRNDVQTAVNTAVSGDSVIVPSGNCNWGSSSVTITNKNITIQGAGVGATVITSNNTTIFNIGSTASRITGFTFTNGVVSVDGGEGWRIDNNRFTSSGSRFSVINISSATIPASGYPYGLIDNNTFTEGSRVLVVPFAAELQQSHQIFYDETALGGYRSVYVEDNVFQHNNSAEPIDANYGSRYVFRFNTISNSQPIHTHSLQQYRGSRLCEVYKNGLSAPTGNWAPVWLRGGTGVIWGNTTSGSWSSGPSILFDNVRSFASYSYGMCAGSSTADGNESGQSGWLCRDQIGAGRDSCLSTVHWSDQTSTASGWCSQTKEPVYLWLNRTPSNGIMPVDNNHNNTGAWIQSNRDFYNEIATFNGTSAVGTGTLASRPSTCTTGVAYWVTDQGNWNKSGSGGQGVLYKCTAPNTWTLHYTPYTYPHPLRNEGPPDAQAPTTPTNLSTSAVSSSQINLSWTASTDNVGVAGYRIYRGGTQIGTSTTNSYSNTGLSPSTTYTYTVSAYDAAGNSSSQSSSASATTHAPDTTPPTVSITSPGSGSTVSGSVTVSATASDNTAVVGVQFKLDGVNLGSEDTSSPYSITWNTAQTSNGSHALTATARDAAGNQTTSTGITVTVSNAAADTQAPSTPTNLSATTFSSTQINLSWTASTDNVGVTGYRIYRCQGSFCTPTVQIATSGTNSYQNTGLTASTTYRYLVRAYDGAGNISSYSSTASATTHAPPDTTPPAAPTSLGIQ